MLGRLLDLQEQWRHFFSTHPATSGAWVRAPPPLAAHGFTMGSRAAANNAQEASGSSPTSSHLPSLVGGDKQRHLRSKGNTTNKQFYSVLDMFKAFCSLFLPVSFFLLSMAHLVVAVVRGR